MFALCESTYGLQILVRREKQFRILCAVFFYQTEALLCIFTHGECDDFWRFHECSLLIQESTWIKDSWIWELDWIKMCRALDRHNHLSFSNGVASQRDIFRRTMWCTQCTGVGVSLYFLYDRARIGQRKAIVIVR